MCLCEFAIADAQRLISIVSSYSLSVECMHDTLTTIRDVECVANSGC